MNQQDMIDVYVRLSALGLASSQRAFGVEWCGRSPSLITDYARSPRGSVRAGTVATLRMRLREAAEALTGPVSLELRGIEEEIARACSWSGQLARRVAMVSA